MPNSTNDPLRIKACELRKSLGCLGKQLNQGDNSRIIVWVIPGALACAHRPLRHHPCFGGSRRDLPEAATSAVVGWVDDVMRLGFRSIICLMHPKEIAHYSALKLAASDLLAYYRSRGIQVCHRPWDDPAHRPAEEKVPFAQELERIRSECLTCFDELPKPVLLHCSAGIDRSSPVAAFIWANRSE